MAKPAKTDESTQPLAIQAAAMGAGIRLKYGPAIGWPELNQLLQDRACAPYPCEVRFDADPLLPGEFAHSLPKGLNPEEGYTIYVHPEFKSQLTLAPYLVLYQLALVTYGESASADAAETFGAHALGLTKEDYFQALCEMADQLSGDELC